MINAFQLGELDRRLAEVARVGVIEAVRHGRPARARVRIGSWVSGWLPWTSLAAGKVRKWRAPTKGEQVMLLNPSGLPEGGFILPGFNTNEHDQPDDRDHVTADHMPDGAKIEYDWQARQYLVDVPAGGKIVLRIGATTLELRDDGVTLTTPRFDGVQS